MMFMSGCTWGLDFQFRKNVYRMALIQRLRVRVIFPHNHTLHLYYRKPAPLDLLEQIPNLYSILKKQLFLLVLVSTVRTNTIKTLWWLLGMLTNYFLPSIKSADSFVLLVTCCCSFCSPVFFLNYELSMLCWLLFLLFLNQKCFF